MELNWYFELQLAAKGLNIVLVSRSPLKLQDTKLEIGIYFFVSSMTYIVAIY